METVEFRTEPAPVVGPGERGVVVVARASALRGKLRIRLAAIAARRIALVTGIASGPDGVTAPVRGVVRRVRLRARRAVIAVRRFEAALNSATGRIGGTAMARILKGAHRSVTRDWPDFARKAGCIA